MNPRTEVPPGCLSGWRVSRAALGELGPDERTTVDAHLAMCARCQELVAAERSAVAAARLEPIPAAVIAAVPPRRRPWASRWLPGLGGLAALATAALVFVVTRPADPSDGGLRLKGTRVVTATVVRGGAVHVEAPLGALGPLADGDRLALAIKGGGGRAVRVASLEGGAWLALHTGVVAADGSIAVPLRVVAGSATELRVTSCERAADLDAADAAPSALPSGCEREAHRLDVR